MMRWMIRMRLLTYGAVTYGVLQGVGSIDYTQVWTQFLSTWLSVLVAVLLGGDVDQFVRNLNIGVRA